MVEINFHHAYPLLTVGWVKIVAHHSMQNQFGLKRTAKSILVYLLKNKRKRRKRRKRR